jgi:hypothetical protein
MRDYSMNARNVTVTWLPQVMMGGNGRCEGTRSGRSGGHSAFTGEHGRKTANALARELMKRVVTHHRSLFFMSNFP